MAPKNPWHRNRLIRDGIYAAIQEKMKADDRIYLLGEGSHMKIHVDAPSIEKQFPLRIITMPISEDANSNFAVGMSLAGLVPIVDVISSDFLFRTMDAICNTMAKMETVGKARTIVVRAEFMTGGPTSGQRIEAMFTHVPGLTVVVPSDGASAERLMHEALDRKGVTIFFEDRMIEDDDLRAFPASVAPVAPRVTMVSYGYTRVLCQQAIASDEQDDVELIDLPVLAPLNLDAVLSSVRRTQNLIIVEPGQLFMGIGAEIKSQVLSLFPRANVQRIGAPTITIPASRDLHDCLAPKISQLQDRISEARLLARRSP